MSQNVQAAGKAKAASVLDRLLVMAPGIGVCLAIAVVAYVVAQFSPVIGAPIIAIAIGVAVANLSGGTKLASQLKVKEISGYALRAGIILLGATLNLNDVAHTGLSSLSLLAVTIGLGFGVALILGIFLGVEWRMRLLIGMGTVICGGSAIAALAPVIRAKPEEIAYSISVIFLFNMLAVIIFPGLGHMMHLTDDGFGLWAGTAVNDTSAVVAAGFAFSKAAGAYATIVKLTRTTLIIPLLLIVGLAMPFLDKSEQGTTGLGARIKKAVPWFILWFVVASLVNTLGLLGNLAPSIQIVARFVMVVALAAVGLMGHWHAFAGAGIKPLLLGLACWVVVAVSSIAVQSWTGQL
jgi:uncharacterized integral membrane protein (TIGR00698 family)